MKKRDVALILFTFLLFGWLIDADHFLGRNPEGYRILNFKCIWAGFKSSFAHQFEKCREDEAYSRRYFHSPFVPAILGAGIIGSLSEVVENDA